MLTILCICLNLLPTIGRYSQAMQSSHLIKNVWDLRSVICVLRQPEEQLLFAIQHKHLIHDADNISSVLLCLCEPQRIAYARAVREHIINWFFCVLNDVLWSLPSYDRLTLVTESQELINNATDLYLAVNTLPTLQQKNGFMIANAHRIKPDDDIQGLISFLELGHRLEFAKRYRQNIRDFLSLFGIIAALDESDRMDYVSQSASLINNAMQVSTMLSQLPSNSQHEFARVHQDKISNIDDLCEILRVFRSSQSRYAFVMTQLAKINQNKLYKLAGYLGSEEYRNLLLQVRPGTALNGMFAEDTAKANLANKRTDNASLMRQTSPK